MSDNTPSRDLSAFHRLLVLERGMTAAEVEQLDDEQALARWSPTAREAIYRLRHVLRPSDELVADPMFSVARLLVRMLGEDVIAHLLLNGRRGKPPGPVESTLIEVIAIGMADIHLPVRGKEGFLELAPVRSHVEAVKHEVIVIPARLAHLEAP